LVLNGEEGRISLAIRMVTTGKAMAIARKIKIGR
jgi:hypothetical protein